MNLPLDANAEKLISERVTSGKYSTPEEVVTAALHALEHDEKAGDFAEGEWEELVAKGDASERLDGEIVLAELRELRQSKKAGKRG